MTSVAIVWGAWSLAKGDDNQGKTLLTAAHCHCRSCNTIMVEAFNEGLGARSLPLEDVKYTSISTECWHVSNYDAVRWATVRWRAVATEDRRRERWHIRLGACRAALKTTSPCVHATVCCAGDSDCRRQVCPGGMSSSQHVHSSPPPAFPWKSYDFDMCSDRGCPLRLSETLLPTHESP